MENTDLKQSTTKEKNRIKKLLKSAGTSEARLKMLEPVIENTAWMKAKLDDSRKLIKNTRIMVPYDNGGGQKGVRQNPAFKGYEALWKSYMSGMDRILSTLPPEEQQTAAQANSGGDPKNVLELVLSKHQKEA